MSSWLYPLVFAFRVVWFQLQKTDSRLWFAYVVKKLWNGCWSGKEKTFFCQIGRFQVKWDLWKLATCNTMWAQKEEQFDFLLSHTGDCRSRCDENRDRVSCKAGQRGRQACFTSTTAAAVMVNFLSSHSPQDCSTTQSAATRHLYSHPVIMYCLLAFYVHGCYTCERGSATALPSIESLR